ncbi:hypothetical protein BX661DRAFT_181431 [Kickxella alabastrina]|uniref:uncharacterized protein n=1 Tax=Kickxella alabastrina TaxID=61397 RepID=UPI00222038A1|nr:uncharacterized protein BX661DRAFT_181431 [Kickxella alabastrina]KAI7829136.1 hypothetical protein BX661DRAFT_181431 [Kickxella alabastrina]
MEQQQLQNSQQQQQQQRVVRSSSTKKTAPRAHIIGQQRRWHEYDVDGQNGSGSGQSERETSPSIPLMFEQQCQNMSFDIEAASSALSESMLLSGPTMGNHTNAFMPCFRNTTKNSSNSSNVSSSGDTVFKSASPDANRADTVVGWIDSNDFNFLAELISVSGGQGGGVIESCNFNSSVSSGGNMSYIAESMVDTGKCPNMFTLANSGTDIRQNAMQPSATSHLDHTPSPTKTHTDSETQFRSGTKVSAPSAGGAESAHGLASPLAFGAALFGKSKTPYLLDGSNGF